MFSEGLISSQLYDNLITAQNGCRVLEASTQIPKGQAANVLTATRKVPTAQYSKDLWITESAPPQNFVLDLTRLRVRPETFNIFGLDCWHDYNTNPALIELLGSEDGKKYSSLAQFPVERMPGWQYFKLPTTLFSKVRYLQVLVLKNYGGEKTYINQVMLGLESKQPDTAKAIMQQPHENPLGRFLPQQHEFYPEKPQREKGVSEHLKLTSTQRQLKKMIERVAALEQQNGSIKKKMLQQEGVLRQMQETVGMLIENMEKLQRIVDRQQQRVSAAEKKPNPERKQKSSNDTIRQNPNIDQKLFSTYAGRAMESQQHRKPPLKGVTGYNQFARSKKERSNRKDTSESESEASNRIGTRIDRSNESDEMDIKRTKILPLLEQLQLKIAEKSKLQERLGSTHRRQSMNDSDQFETYQHE